LFFTFIQLPKKKKKKEKRKKEKDKVIEGRIFIS
jgi:hypothetical protein